MDTVRGGRWSRARWDRATAASELEKAIGDRLAKLDGCYTGKHGSLRALLLVAFDGGVIDARVGGLGDREVEACVATNLVGLKVGPPPIVSEVACDFVRGDPQPWRVTPDAGYTVIELAQATPLESVPGLYVGLDSIGATIAPSIRADGKTAFLIVANPDLSGAKLSRVLRSTTQSAATLVAVKSDGGPPIFIGMGPDGRTHEAGDEAPTQIRLDVRADGQVSACAGDKLVATSDAIVALAKECTADPTCTSTLALHLDAARTAGDLAAVATAALRGGFERIALGGAPCPTK